MKRNFLNVGLILFLAVIFSAFSNAPALATQPTCPNANAITNPGNQTVPEATIVNGVRTPTVVTLDGTKSNPKDGVTCVWTSLSNPQIAINNATSCTATFTAPDVGPSGASFVFQLTVRETQTGCTSVSDSKSTTISITNVNQNQPPVATAIVSPGSTVGEGTIVTLDGTSSSDPNGDALSYSWSQTAGPSVTLAPNSNGSIATFTAPTVPYPNGSSLTFRLTVSDGSLTNSADKIINVTWVNDPPVAQVSCPASANEGDSITLSGAGSTDNDGDGIASYAWVQESGLPNADLSAVDLSGASINFTAPQLTSQYDTMTFKLTVTDNGGLYTSAQCSIKVNDITPPVITVPANITKDATGPDGAAVEFTVTANDAHDGNVPVSCSPESGSTFAIGTTSVNCSAGDSANNLASGGFTVTVQKVNQTITFDPLSEKTYGDPDFVVNATADSGLPVSFAASGNCTVSGSTVHITGAGSCSVTASQEGDSWRNPALDVQQSFSIKKATAKFNVTGWTGTYDGDAHGATGTAKGVFGEDLTANLNLGATFTNVPGGTANWTFSGNANYNDANGSVTITINKADATIKVSGWSGTYDGTAHGATGTATGVKGESLSAYLNFGSTFTNVSGGTAHWTFTGGTNYNDASGDVAITINPRSITVKADDKTITLGDATPVFSYSVTAGSVVTGDALGTASYTFNGSSVIPTGAGIYTIAVSGLSNTNYSITYSTGTFKIIYGLGGLLSPYDSNKAYKIKSAIPIKWQYTNNAGTVVNSSAAKATVEILGPTTTGAYSDELVITLNDAGSSGYQYDTLTNTWQFNWKTTGLAPGLYYIKVESAQTGQYSYWYPITLVK